MAKTFEDVAKTTHGEMEKALKQVNKALAGKKLEEYHTSLRTLEEAVKTHNKALCNIEYAKFVSQPNPIIAAVQQFYISLARVNVKKDKDTGEVTDVDIAYRNSAVDLEKLVKFGKLPHEWADDCDELLALLSLRETDIFAMSPSELYTHNALFVEAASKKKSGDTPDSNTKIVKLIQKIIDEAIFVDDGTGKNCYKCNNHDIEFIKDAVTKLDTKEKCTIAMCNERNFKMVMMNVFAHVLGEAYKVKVAKTKKDRVAEAELAKLAKKAAEESAKKAA